MYIKKSIISVAVLVVTAMILLAITFVYGFTEIPISKIACAVIWTGCIFLSMKFVDDIQAEE